MIGQGQAAFLTKLVKGHPDGVRVEVGIGEVLLDSGPEPHGGGINDISGLCLSTTSKNATNTSTQSHRGLETRRI